jgi:putative ABC transport system ATP-binding protein
MQIEIVQDLAAAVGVELSRPTLAQALGQAESEIQGAWADVWSKRLDHVSGRLGLRSTSLRVSIKAVADLLRPGVAALIESSLPGDKSWSILTASGGGAVKVLDPTHQLSAWMSEPAFAAKLGIADQNTPVNCLIVEAALPCQTANTFTATDNAPSHMKTVIDHHDHDTHLAAHEHLPPLKRLFGILKPDKSDIWAIIWYAVGISILMLVTPITIQALVSTVAFGSVYQPLVVLSLVLLFCLIFAAILRAMQTYLVEILQRRIFIRVMADLAQRLPRVKISAFDRQHGPELVNRFFDVLTVQKISATLLMDGITIILQAGIGMAVVAFYHPILFSLDVILLGAIAFIIFGLGRGAIRTAIQESITKYRVAEWLQELARHPITFKMEGGGEYAIQRADSLAADYLTSRETHFRIIFRQIIASLMLQAVAGTALLSIGGWLVINNSLTLGQLIAAELILSAVIASFVKFGKHLESFYDLMAATDKLGHLIDLDLERATGEMLPLKSTGASLELHDVTYGYDDHSHVLEHFQLQLGAGERVALFAPNGQGKSTLTEILYGLRQPQHGQMTIDGIDYRDIRLDSLRQHLAIVGANEIFEGTIADNIRMGRDYLLVHDVRRILSQVGLLDAVMQLPEGLQTILTTGGAPLSTSQVQRLMLARAIAGNPRLLIIDEILDHLVTENNDPALTTLLDRSMNWTVLIITARRELFSVCDRVIQYPNSDNEPTEHRTVNPEHKQDKH